MSSSSSGGSSTCSSGSGVLEVAALRASERAAVCGCAHADHDGIAITATSMTRATPGSERRYAKFLAKCRGDLRRSSPLCDWLMCRSQNWPQRAESTVPEHRTSTWSACSSSSPRSPWRRASREPQPQTAAMRRKVQQPHKLLRCHGGNERTLQRSVSPPPSQARRPAPQAESPRCCSSLPWQYQAASLRAPA